MKYKEDIENLIKDTTNITEPISVDAELQSLGIDSLSFVLLIVKIENHFNITFPDDKLSVSEAGTLRKLCIIIINIKDGQEKH